MSASFTTPVLNDYGPLGCWAPYLLAYALDYAFHTIMVC